MCSVEQVTDERALFGESPVWDHRQAELLWVDIPQGTLHRLDPLTGIDRSCTFSGRLAAVALGPGSSVVVARERCVYVTNDESFPHLLANVDTGDRINDIGCDPAGRLFLGTLTTGEAAGACALYRLDRLRDEWHASTVVSAVTLSNGLDWSPDGRRMYYTDTATRRIDFFDYEVTTGALTARRVFADLSDSAGRPDGLTVDREGGLWVAVARAGEIRRYRGDGTLDRVVVLPVPRVTSLAFGGKDYGDLYVTTAKDPDRGTHQPGAGAVFRLRPGVSGLPSSPWSGP